MDYSFLKQIPGAIVKPEKRSTTQNRKRRLEAMVAKLVRVLVAERDGYCRIDAPTKYVAMADVFGVCAGPSEWAHLESSRRARTRCQKPEQRHTTKGTAMLCRKHHRDYDAGKFVIEADKRLGADGLMFFRKKDPK